MSEWALRDARKIPRYKFFLKGNCMLPTKAVRLQLGELLAADDTTLAPAMSANKVALVKNAFTPDENAVIGDFDLADFDGSTPITGATGTQQVGISPSTGDQIITIKEVAGGWRWETTGVTNLPQTIYGAILMNNGGTTLLGMQLLDPPLTLSEAGQEVNLGSVKMTMALQPLE